MFLDIRNELSLWAAWGIPLLPPVLVAVLAAILWGSAKATLKVDVKAYRGLYVAATSVLAIVVPLAGNLILDVRTSSSSVALGLLLSATTLSVIALLLGAFILVKTISITTDHFTIQGGGQNSGWMAILGSVQFTCVALFLVTAIVALALLALSSTDETSGSVSHGHGRFVMRHMPRLGVTEESVLAAWGNPRVQGDEWASYTLDESRIVFCFTEGRLKRIMELTKEEGDALGVPC